MINLRESKEYLEFGYKIIRCPVCGKETLDNHFICPTCNWEYDDEVEFKTGDEYSTANDCTLNEHLYSYKFKKYVEELNS